MRPPEAPASLTLSVNSVRKAVSETRDPFDVASMWFIGGFFYQPAKTYETEFAEKAEGSPMIADSLFRVIEWLVHGEKRIKNEQGSGYSR